MVQEDKAKDAQKRQNTTNTNLKHFGNLLKPPLQSKGHSLRYYDVTNETDDEVFQDIDSFYGYSCADDVQRV